MNFQIAAAIVSFPISFEDNNVGFEKYATLEFHSYTWSPFDEEIKILNMTLCGMDTFNFNGSNPDAPFYRTMETQKNFGVFGKVFRCPTDSY